MEDNLFQDFQKRENQRKRKKTTILAIPILFIVFIIVIVVIFNQPKPTCSDGRKNGNEQGIDCGGLCVACGIKYAEPIKVLSDDANSDGRVLTIDNTLSELVVKIQNVNSGYGAKFHYDISLFNPIGQDIGKISGDSFIFPASSKYLIEPKISIKSNEISRVKISFSDIEWFASDKAVTDIFSVYDKKAVILSATDTGYLEISGKISNKTSHDFKTVNLQILLYSKTGRLLHAAKTIVSDVLANNNAKEFSYIGFPYFSGFSELDLNRVEIAVDALLE